MVASPGRVLLAKGDLGIIPSCQKGCFINPFVVKKTSGSFESLRNSCCLGRGVFVEAPFFERA